jgi:predicted GNAT family acetyltransferase
VDEQDILGKVVALGRKGRLRSLRFESTAFYYMFVKLISLCKELLKTGIKQFYSLAFAGRYLKVLFPLKTRYVVISSQEEDDLFKSFCNLLPVHISENPILCRLLAFVDKRPIAKIWILQDKNKNNLLLYGPYVKLLYRRRGVGSTLVKSALKAIDKDAEDVYVFLSYKDERSVRFFKDFGFKKCLLRGSLIDL